MSDHHDDHAHTHHVTSLPVLFATFAALVVLTLLTVAQARMLPAGLLGNFEIFVTLFIATIKASLVALIFMQLAHDKPFNVVIVVSALFFVALFLGFTLIDSTQYLPDVREFRYNHVPFDAVP
jgi:cytochrome c oxidase subunit IV